MATKKKAGCPKAGHCGAKRFVATSDVTMKTITAAATGTVATVVEKVATQGSSRIVRNANVWIRQRRTLRRKSAAAPAKVLAGRVINAVTMEITTVAVAGMVVTAAERVETSISFLTVQNASAKIPRR